MSHNHHIEAKEYDLNLFFTEDYDEATDSYVWSDTLTIQPSLYMQYSDGMVNRRYLESFKLSLEETRAIMPDFPGDEYGSDFFIGLEFFLEQAKACPGRVKQILATLPHVDEVPVNDDLHEIQWLDTLFIS